ncbi:MAG: feruloyl-CoA synthase [Endozoicomonas sp.]
MTITTGTRFPAPDIARSEQSGQDFTLFSRVPLEPYPERVLEALPVWANQAPDRPFISQRDDSGQWQAISYGEMFTRVRSLARFFIEQGCSTEKTVAVLSENSIASATVILAGIYAGIPVVPISAAYSTIPEAFDRLEYCLQLVTPGVVFVEDSGRFSNVLDRLALPEETTVLANRATEGVISLAEALDTDPEDIDAVFAATSGDTLVKILFTSGSTGKPKGVMNTNRMMSANQQQLLQIYPFLAQEAPVLLDWLPWSHTFGGNEVFTLTLWHGGHLYIDEGKPVADKIDITLANLREVQPTVYFNVPLGYDLLASALEKDESLRQQFFGKLKMLFYSASALPQSIRDRLDYLSSRSAGRKTAIVTAWGATETAPLVTGVHYQSERTDNIGVPVSGCEVKFARVHGRYELRVRGPQVTPGYWRNPEQSAQAFDEQGFYRTGDAACLMDEHDPSKGIIFAGRVSEDFKLSSGTWVAVSNLRVALVNALLPLAQDVVILGQDQDSLSLLVFPNANEFQSGEKPEEDDPDFIVDKKLISAVLKRLESFNREHTASSMRIHRFAILAHPPSLKHHEITEKGTVNQRAVIKNRELSVQRVYSDDIGSVIIG